MKDMKAEDKKNRRSGRDGKIDEAVGRIREMEKILDKACEAVDQLELAIEGFGSLSSDIAKLESYYTGKDWKKDLALDEKGLLPEDLKRGVLSEDAVNDLLDRVLELERKLDP